MLKEYVSLIVPCYNVAKTLQSFLDSVLQQTYTYIQLILVNDGSTDNSWELCQNIQKKDSRIKIINQKNSGVSVARNKGIDAANGKWTMFVDADDKLNKKIVEFLVAQVKPKIDIVACSCYGFDDEGQK